MSGPIRLRILAIIGVISVFGWREFALRLFNQFDGFIFPQSDVERGLTGLAPVR